MFFCWYNNKIWNTTALQDLLLRARFSKTPLSDFVNDVFFFRLSVVNFEGGTSFNPSFFPSFSIEMSPSLSREAITWRCRCQSHHRFNQVNELLLLTIGVMIFRSVGIMAFLWAAHFTHDLASRGVFFCFVFLCKYIPPTFWYRNFFNWCKQTIYPPTWTARHFDFYVQRRLAAQRCRAFLREPLLMSSYQNSFCLLVYPRPAIFQSGSRLPARTHF